MPGFPPGPIETAINLLFLLIAVFLVGGVIGLIYQWIKRMLRDDNRRR
jgi:hypothetical protein